MGLKRKPMFKATTFFVMALTLGQSTARANSVAALLATNATALPDLVEKVLPGVVNISSTTIVKSYEPLGFGDFFGQWGIPRESHQSTLGSGLIIDQQGYILTNFHVVDHATEVMATLNDKKQYKAKIIGKDQKLDVALLQIKDKDGKVPAITSVPLGDSNIVRIAEPVFAVGNPFGLQHTVTMGIISAKNRTIGAGPFDNFLQTDASINPGNSGGPLFNLKGEVIGINTAIFSKSGQSGGLGFAIPINEAKDIIADLKRYGHVPRPWIGVLGQPITPALEAYYELPASKGVLIVNLVNRGPADRTGVKQGDILVSLDGTNVADLFEVERALAKKHPHDTAAIKIKRGRKTLDLVLKLEELPPLQNLPQGIL